jgi:hypothetical protein
MENLTMANRQFRDRGDKLLDRLSLGAIVFVANAGGAAMSANSSAVRIAPNNGLLNDRTLAAVAAPNATVDERGPETRIVYASRECFTNFNKCKVVAIPRINSAAIVSIPRRLHEPTWYAHVNGTNVIAPAMRDAKLNTRSAAMLNVLAITGRDTRDMTAQRGVKSSHWRRCLFRSRADMSADELDRDHENGVDRKTVHSSP